MSRPLKVQIVERARQLIADEHHWCCRHFGEDANGFPVSPTSTSATKRCALGAVIEAAYQLTPNLDVGPRYGSATLIHVHASRGNSGLHPIKLY
jgi:hypothetical protein